MGFARRPLRSVLKKRRRGPAVTLSRILTSRLQFVRVRTGRRSQTREMLEGRPRAIELALEDAGLHVPRRDRGGF